MAASKRQMSSDTRPATKAPDNSRRARIFAWILIVLMLGSVLTAFSYVLVE